MRVLHVASGRLYGGVERMLVTLAESAGGPFDFEFAIAAPGRLAEELRAAGATVHGLGDVRLGRPLTVWRARRRLDDLLERARFDVVLCHAPWAYAIFAPVARRRGVRAGWWQHDRATGRPLVERWARATPADLVIGNSQWTAASARTVQPRAPVAVVYCPVSIQAPSPSDRESTRASLGARTDDVVILSASRMEPWKGHRELLAAVAELPRDGRWVVWIAGAAQRPHEVEYQALLARDVSRRGLDGRVRWLGERRDVPALMRAADLLCQPNVTAEPFGVVFAEALSCGLPVVTTDMGGAREIVDQSCGRLVAPSDPQALAAALREMVLDGSLRMRLAVAGPGQAASRCALPSVLRTLHAALALSDSTVAR